VWLVVTASKKECNWKKTKLEVFWISWKESSTAYREALKTARSAYFSNLLKEKNQNPLYLFEKVAKLTKNKVSSPEVSKQHSSNDFRSIRSIISGRK